MLIAIPTNSENPRLAFSGWEKFYDGSGYRVDLTVRSGGFALSKDFFFEQFALDRSIDELSAIEEKLSGIATLKPMWEEDFIRLEMAELGHLAVIGEFTERGQFNQSLSFGFEADQTSLRPLREALVVLAKSELGAVS